MNREWYKKTLGRIKGETDRVKQVGQLTRIIPKILMETDLSDYEAMCLSQEAADIENIIGITAAEQQKIDRAIFEMFERLLERR